jgi:hypothetical protein
MTQSKRILIPATALLLVFVVVDLFLPSSVREQSSYRVAGEIFSMLLLVYFAYTRQMPEQRNLRTACFVALAGTLALFAAERVGRGAVWTALQAVALLCFLSAAAVFVRHVLAIRAQHALHKT